MFILKLQPAVASTFHYVDSSVMSKKRWHKRKTEEKKWALINAFPLLPQSASIHSKSIFYRDLRAKEMGHVAESTGGVSLSQMLLTATLVLPPHPQRCWFSLCVNCAFWHTRETDADTFCISDLNLSLSLFFLTTVNSSLLPWVIGLISGNNRSLAPSHMISFFVLAACKNLSWSLVF